MPGYPEPQRQGQQQPQPQYTQEELYQMQQEEMYYDRGDPWQKARNNDPSIQVREALYDSVETQHNDAAVFESWVNSRRVILTRASRIPGIDVGYVRRLSRKFKYIVAHAHSEGKAKILRSMCENFDFEIELLVSRGDVQMQGVTGITSMISQNLTQKQEVKYPQIAAPPSVLSTLGNLIPGRK